MDRVAAVKSAGTATREATLLLADGSGFQGQGLGEPAIVSGERTEIHGQGRRVIVLLDCGNKRAVIDELVHRGTRVMVVPAHLPAADILALSPQGLIVSNGPGNPRAAGSIVETIRQLWGR